MKIFCTFSLSLIFCSFFVQGLGQIDSLNSTVPKKRNVYLTTSATIIRVSDTVMIAKLAKPACAAFRGEIVFGNLQQKPIHFFVGLGYARSGSKSKKTSSGDFQKVPSSAAEIFFTELGFRGYLNPQNLNRNPMFFKLSWIHGVHDIVSQSYNNEFNAINFGIGITKPFPSNKLFYHFALDYSLSKQTKKSAFKNGQRDLNAFNLTLGLTF